MSVAKRQLEAQFSSFVEPSPEELFEEALARADDRDYRHEAHVAENRNRIRLVVNNRLYPKLAR